MAAGDSGLSSADVAALGGYAGPDSGTSSVSDSGGASANDSFSLSGLSSIFSTVGSAFSSAYRSVNPVVQAPAGSVIYNPQTGGYVSRSGLVAAQTSAGLSPIILIAGGLLVVFLLMRK